ncbi:MAG: fasciclin domain-containing protein [Prevotella sp.]|nr:fasciclin domain-containing protein [Prevotella sp.]
MKKIKYIGIMMMAAGLLTVASCSEFDDYNKEIADVTPSGNQTLWKNIQQHQQLQNFASILKKAGYDEKLNTTHYYTVWAPMDGTYDANAIQQLSDKSLLSQFVENHIANYSFNASGQIDQRVLMLNDKSYQFAGSQNNYTFDGVKIEQPNQGSSNGVMHIMKGMAAYYPSLYEYLMSEELSGNDGVDSLRNFLQKYETTYLDEEHSVVGPIVNGMQTYVDSVMITENTQWDMLNTRMENEDSSYTFLMPTNEAWKSQYDKVKTYYNYAPKTIAQQFSGSSITNTTPLSIDAAYWQDSLTNRVMTMVLPYSNNDIYNRWLNGTPTSYGSDTLRTTLFNKLSNPQEILNKTVKTVEFSNGTGRIISDFGMYPWETYAPERVVSATRADNRALISNGTGSRVDVIDVDKEKVELEDGATTFSYYHVEPTGGNEFIKPEMTFYLRNVQSTTYDIYCVFVPEHVDLQKKDAVTTPNRVIFTLNYCDATGTLKNQLFLNTDQSQIDEFKTRFPTVRDNASQTNANHQTIRAFSNDTSKVDTLYVGEFTFPVCYLGLGDEYCPNIKISTPYSVFTAALREAYTRDLRIASIILKPKELVEFEEQNKK